MYEKWRPFIIYDWQGHIRFIGGAAILLAQIEGKV